MLDYRPAGSRCFQQPCADVPVHATAAAHRLHTHHMEVLRVSPAHTGFHGCSQIMRRCLLHVQVFRHPGAAQDRYSIDSSYMIHPKVLWVQCTPEAFGPAGHLMGGRSSLLATLAQSVPLNHACVLMSAAPLARQPYLFDKSACTMLQCVTVKPHTCACIHGQADGNCESKWEVAQHRGGAAGGLRQGMCWQSTHV